MPHKCATHKEQHPETLWRAYKADQDHRAREALLRRYAPLVTITAGRLCGPLPPDIERGDLIGAGAIGLIKAVDSFDYERGIKFETYAITLIRGAILEMLRRESWVPRLVCAQQREIEAAQRRLLCRLGRAATEEEVASELGISRERLHKRLAEIGRASVLSWEDTTVTPSGTGSLSDLLAAQGPTPFDLSVLAERKQTLGAAIDRLPERERRVLALYYYEGLTFKEAGSVMDISETRAFQLHAAAIRRLRQSLDDEETVDLCR